MGVINLGGRIAQNRALLGFEEGVRELAVFALAMAFYWPIVGLAQFLPQFSAVMIRGRRSLSALLRFSLAVSLLAMTLMACIGLTDTGYRLVVAAFNTGESATATIQAYLVWLLPAPPFFVFSQLLTGLVVKARRTGIVTASRVLTLTATVATLAVGIAVGAEPFVVLSLSVIIPEVVSFLLVGGACLVTCRSLYAKPGERPSWGDLIRFYWPMALTTVMFTLSRPVIFNVISHSNALGADEQQLLIAALSLAFTYGLIFQLAVNQFRHVSVSFADEKAFVVRRFMLEATCVIAGLMAAAHIGGASRWFLEAVQGAKGLLLDLSDRAVWPLLLAPVVVAWRNYYHGIAMARQRTTVMGLASIARNVAIYGVGMAYVATQSLGPVTAGSLIIVGFATEGLIAMLYVKRWKPAEAK